MYTCGFVEGIRGDLKIDTKWKYDNNPQIMVNWDDHNFMHANKISRLIKKKQNFIEKSKIS